MILEVLRYPDPRLRERAGLVLDFTPEVQRLIDDMAETMYCERGVGLAAPQVGELVRIFVLDCAAPDDPSELLVFINPEILESSGEHVWPEGCLSFPGIQEGVKRAQRVKVRAKDRDGKPFELEATGLLGVAIQHEMDHLDGKLMIDRLSPLKRKLLKV